MCHFLDGHCLQLMKVQISMPESLIHRHRIMQKSRHFFMLSMFMAITSNTQCNIHDFWNFHSVQPSRTLEAMWYCLRAFTKAHILLPKVVNIALALLQPVDCLTVSEGWNPGEGLSKPHRGDG